MNADRSVRMVVLIALSLLISPFVVLGGDNLWTSRGPTGGTFPVFTFHPSRSTVIFAGSFDGLYRSTSGGATWQRLDISEGQDLPVSVRIPRQDTGTVYASTEQFLFRSTDLGTNWQEVSRLPAEFSEFEFHPADPSILYSVTLRNGVFRSNDGGRTWVAKRAGLRLTPVAPCCDLPQLEVDPRNGNILYVLLGSRLAYRSGNGGDSWTAVSGLRLTEDVRSLIIDPTAPDTMYAASGDGLFKSTNAGAAWSLLNCDCWTAGVALDPQKSQNIYVAGDGLYKSVNGGASWSRVGNSGPAANAPFAGLAVSPFSGSQIVIGGDGGGIYRSRNGGQSIQPVNNLVDAMPVRHLSSSPQRPADIHAQGDFQVFRSRNAGASWSLWPLGHDYEMTDIQVHLRNANIVAATGYFEDAAIAVSADGGTTWNLRGPQGADGASAVGMDPSNENVLLVAALSGAQKLGLARSTDQGRSWGFVNSGLTDKSILDIVVDPSSGAIVYASTSTGKVFKSVNSGTSWKNSSSGLRGGSVYSLAFDPNNSSTLYAATERGLLKSTNAGQSWILRSQGIPPGLELLFVRTDPSNPQVVFTGGEDSIFVSADAGQNWSAYDANGLGRYLASDMLINPAQPSVFHLGVNRGVFSYRKSAVTGGPEILQLLPSSGKAGGTVSIQGRNFGAAQGSSRVLFGTVDSGTAVSWSDARIQVRVPASAQTGPVSVLVGSRRSNTMQFVVLASSGAIQPATGPRSGGTLVSIVSPSQSGNLSFVLFGTSLARDVRFLPPNTVVCRTPPGSGVVDVSVVTAAGIFRAGTFSYQ